MNLRRLYRTIESFASEHFKTDKEVLKHILNEIVKDENIKVKGGRIWQYEASTESYRLIHQIGVIEKVDIGYKIPVTQYPMFQALTEQRSIIAHETDKYLRKKGIVKYSATGVGEKIPWKNGLVYQYVLAFNSDFLDQSLQADLNIISLAASSVLRGRRIERKAKQLEMDIDKAREIQLNILPESAFTAGQNCGRRFLRLSVHGFGTGQAGDRDWRCREQRIPGCIPGVVRCRRDSNGGVIPYEDQFSDIAHQQDRQQGICGRAVCFDVLRRVDG
jgi:hypothetical protein